MSNPEDVLRSLLSVITSATEDAIREYKLSGCAVPSIDTKTEPQLPYDPTGLKKALRVLEGATRQLSSTLTPPATTIYTRSMANNDVACLRVAASAKIPDIIYGLSEGMHIKEIAEKAGLHAGKLLKVMRYLASTHCFLETAPDVFTNNALSLTLREEDTVSSFVKIVSTETNKCAVSNYYDTLVDPEYGQSLDARRSSWSYGIRNEIPNGTMFDYLEAHPSTMAKFHLAMGGLSKVTGIESVINQFPWKELPVGTKVCDVGSGIGTVSIELARKYPNLHLTLQDLPSVVSTTEHRWEVDYPAAAAEGRVDFTPIDFLKESPVAGQDIYYIRQIIHDWPVDDCVKILRGVRAAMKPGSRVLIHEYIVPSNVSGPSVDSGVEAAPDPLLPNFGYGSVRTYYQDVLMNIIFNAGERTVDEFSSMGAQAGLRFVKVWDFLDTGLVEFEADTD